MTSDAPTGRFDIGRVISRTFGVLRRNLAMFAGLSLVLSGLPSLLLSFSAQQLRSNSGADFSIDASWIALAVLGAVFGLLAGVLLQGAVVFATARDINGQPASVGECLGSALPHALPLIGIGICAGTATLFGALLFLVPGIIIALALCVSSPVRVVEGLGVFASLGRSGDLTRGHRWMLFLLFFLYGIAINAVQAAATALASLFSFGGFGGGNGIGVVIVNTLVQTLVAPVGAVGIASVYIELREIKEGGGLEALAAVFD